MNVTKEKILNFLLVTYLKCNENHSDHSANGVQLPKIFIQCFLASSFLCILLRTETSLVELCATRCRQMIAVVKKHPILNTIISTANELKETCSYVISVIWRKKTQEITFVCNVSQKLSDVKWFMLNEVFSRAATFFFTSTYFIFK